MELELFRHDILQTSSCARGSLAVLPMGEERKTQKVAAGDLSGVMQVFSVKKGEIAVLFKQLPSHHKVTSVSTGKGKNQRDKVFVAAGNTIKGINRKGKEFFKMNTQMTEQICKVDVCEKLIWASAEYIHNQYVEGKDKGFFLSPDRINDAEILPLISANDYIPIMACQDRYLRVVDGNDLFYEAPTPSAPISVRYNPETHDPANRVPTAKEVLYGTESGTMIQLLCESDQARMGFTMQNPKKLGAIRCIYSGIDFTKTGISDIAVGREDGTLEVFDQDETGQLIQVFSIKLSESINALDGGYVTSTNVQDLVLQSFSGKILSFTPPGGGMLLDKMDKRLGPKASAEDERRVAYDAQIQRLRYEIDELAAGLELEKQKFSRSNGNLALLSVSAPTNVQGTFKLEEDEACYSLSIESAMPIFTVAVLSTLSLQLMDVANNVAILSRSPPDEVNGNMTVATYRCQDATSRLSVKFKLREGKSGTLSAFVIPNISPKTCTSLSHKIRPLCLHMRLSGTADPFGDQAANELLLAGSFSLAEIHSWVSNLLNDVPPLQAEQDECDFRFKNCLLGTTLTCKYRAGEARFVSNLLSTLSVAHEHIMEDATKNKSRVSVSFNPSADGLKRSIALVWPQMERQRTLQKQFNLLEGLMELKMQDSDISYLTTEFKSILDNAETIKKEYEEMPQHLDHLQALLKDLYLDYCKMKGITSNKQRMPMLDKMLHDTHSTLDEVMEFMVQATEGAR